MPGDMDLELLRPSLGKKKKAGLEIRYTGFCPTEVKSGEQRSETTGKPILPAYQMPLKKKTEFTMNLWLCFASPGFSLSRLLTNSCCCYGCRHPFAIRCQRAGEAV